MKIALIHFNLTTESGDPKMVLSIAQNLQKLGHTIVVYTGEFDAEKCFPRLNRGLDIRVVEPEVPLATTRGATGIVGKIKERFRFVRVYNRLVERLVVAMDRDFDYIICENDYSYKIGVHYKKIKPEAKVVWIMNNPPFFHSRKANPLAELLSRTVSVFEKKSAQKYGSGIDWIIVYDAISERLAKAVGRPVKIIPNPIDVDYFFAAPKKGLAEKKVQLLGVGALSPQRRFEDIIGAVALLREKGYDARSVIICKDFWGNRSYREAFEGFIKSSGVAQYSDVRFGGATEDEYLAAFRTSDVFVLPNDIKIWGVGAFEGMAAGLPLIVSRVTAVADALRDGENALFVDAHRPDLIAAAVEQLAADPALYERIAAAGQTFVTQGMSLRYFIKEILLPPIHA